MTTDQRSGILAGGNFIIDYVKIIDAYPPENTLASILSESSANGGGPYNILKDLAAMGVAFPLEAAGLVGRDANGDRILQDCRVRCLVPRELREIVLAPRVVLRKDPTEVRSAQPLDEGPRRVLGDRDIDASW